MTDRELLNQYTREGSKPAFDEIVSRYTDMVYTACRHVLGDPTQATFMVLIRKASSIPSKEELAGWLFRTARLSAQNLRRMQMRRQQREEEAAAIRRLDSNANASDWNALAPDLHTAIATLPTKQRDAIVLRFSQGKSEAEAAKESRCTN